MMKGSSWALMVAGMMVAAPVAPQGPPEGRGPCGTPNARARADIIEILTLPEYASTREHMQLTGLTADDLVELGRERGDAQVCARLRTTLPSGVRVEGAHAPMAATMYRAGERYIVAIRSKPISEPNPQPRSADQTVSYTLDFEPIGASIRN